MKIIQLTDTHLFADDDAEIFGVKSNLRFNEVVSKMIAEDSHDADMIFLTGDISQDETAASYQKITSHLNNLNIPIYWIPGNHDNLHQLQSIFHNQKNFHRQSLLSSPHWDYIFLNTKVDGREDGELSQSELDILQNEIDHYSHKKIAVIMHHHPVPVQTPLIDHYILKNRESFWDIVNGSNVELIIFGHIHGDYSFMHNNIMIESSPATCLQWEKGTKDLIIDKRIGYKIYYFNEEGFKTITKMW